MFKCKSNIFGFAPFRYDRSQKHSTSALKNSYIFLQHALSVVSPSVDVFKRHLSMGVTGAVLSKTNNWPKLVADVALLQDKAAFAIIFDYFVPRLEAYLRRLGLENNIAEEVSQDTMIILWNKANLFDPAKSSLATWLYRIARNRKIDISRRNRVDFYDPTDGAFTQIADSTPLADVTMDSKIYEDSVKIALCVLPKEQSSMIQMAFYEGLSHNDIAHKTGLPLGTVKSRIRLAFTRLRRALEQKGIAEAG